MKGKNMVVISAPSQDLSVSFIRRIRQHLEPHLGTFESKENVVEINNCRVEAYPSHNLRRLRGITDTAFVLVEESDFWNKNEEDELLPTIMPLLQKSDPYIALVSTPGRLSGLMHRLSQAPESQSRFRKVYIPYSDVLHKLFSEEEIRLAKLQPNFEREFNLQWGYGQSNLFRADDLQRAMDMGLQYANPKFNADVVKRPYPDTLYEEATAQIIGVDPGGGSSLFAICVTQIYDGRLHVNTAQAFERPHEDDMINFILDLFDATNRSANIFCDAANPSFILKLKSKLPPDFQGNKERTDTEFYIDYLRRHNWAGENDQSLGRYMTVVPVSFGKYGSVLLQRLATYIQRGWLVIHPQFQELIESLQSARTKETGSSDWVLDKTSNSHDLLDALRLTFYPLAIERQQQTK
jgi:hypothetical protein